MCSNGYSFGSGGYGNGDGNGDVDGNRNGDGNGNGDGIIAGYGYENGNGYGNGFIEDAEEEQSSAIRLLADDYPDINFYICQLHLMRGGK